MTLNLSSSLVSYIPTERYVLRVRIERQFADLKSVIREVVPDIRTELTGLATENSSISNQKERYWKSHHVHVLKAARTNVLDGSRAGAIFFFFFGVLVYCLSS